jgi:hypothetical protein
MWACGQEELLNCAELYLSFVQVLLVGGRAI